MNRHLTMTAQQPILRKQSQSYAFLTQFDYALPAKATIRGKARTSHLFVEYEHSPACLGMRDSLGVPLEPDQDEEIVILFVGECENGKDVFEFLTPFGQNQLIEECEEHFNELFD